jgi:hypothetical protein
MFTDAITVVLASYATGARGGVQSTYPTGDPTRAQTFFAYVEPQLTTAYRYEPAGPTAAREPSPQARVRYRVYCGIDPSTNLARPLQVDDHILWAGVVLQLAAPPMFYQQVWLIECERVD